MLDSSDPTQAKAKKNKPQTRPMQRFWPESIANIQPQQQLQHDETLAPVMVNESVEQAEDSVVTHGWNDTGGCNHHFRVVGLGI